MAFPFYIFLSNGWTTPCLCITAFSYAFLLILFSSSKCRVETWWHLLDGYQHKGSFYVFICLLFPHCIQSDVSLLLFMYCLVCCLYLHVFVGFQNSRYPAYPYMSLYKSIHIQLANMFFLVHNNSLSWKLVLYTVINTWGLEFNSWVKYV